MFHGIGNGLSTLYALSDAKTRSISSENLTGEPSGGARTELECGSAAHAARDLGKGWKVNPYSNIPAGETFTLADIDGPGCVQHLWMTPDRSIPWRSIILRVYWDGSETPAIECPVGDFFASGWGQYAQISSLAVCVNPSRAFNCYWPMPFRKHARFTLENRSSALLRIFYQLTYALTDVPEDAAYFHAQWRRVNPLPYKDVCTVLDGVRGRGHYAGTYLAWGVNNNGWWGEGEIKFFLDGDTEYPTICGTGTEDYFCGSYNFDVGGRYTPFTTPYTGLAVIPTDGAYQSQQRFGMYRWHITDPIRFSEELRVTIQALGWRSEHRYLPLQDDIASTAFFYLDRPSTVLPPLPDHDFMEII